MAEPSEDRNLNWYATREPVVLVLLSLIAVVFFLAVAGLSNIYHAQQESRGAAWFARGNKDLESHRLQRAVGEYRVALSYSRQDYAYQLGLAQALLALGRGDEAYTYLINLWQREPDNGTVNLELGRLYAEKGDMNQALRYYHNAIYGEWNDHVKADRRAVRIELIEFLVREKARDQAESELIALAGNLPEEPAQHVRVADLFMEVPDRERALGEYQQALKLEHHDPAAAAGAGRAAFELARYSVAQPYLASAVASDPGDVQSADLLHTVERIAKMDPYGMGISAGERRRVIMEDLATAGERLKACLPVNQVPSLGANENTETLPARWLHMKRILGSQRFENHPKLADRAVQLVFDIEVQTSQACGTPTGPDLALLLIARAHEGS
jgi:tetratricopeptide (TPR) repeat protein